MSEHLDRDLGRAIKEEIGLELQGFEFSAKMKVNVMKQIRAGQSGLVVPFERQTPSRKFVVPCPLIWTAFAVAAFAFALNLNLGPKDSMGVAQDGARLETGLTMAPPAASPAPAPDTATATATASAQEAEPMGSPTMKAAGVDVSQVPARLIELQPGAARPAAPLTASAPSMAPPSLNLRLATMGQDLLVVSTGGMKRLTGSNSAVWQINPGGITPQSILVVSPAGKSALSAGNAIHVISSAGVLERTLLVTDLVTDLVWSADDRLAVTAGSILTVFRGDGVDLRKDVVPGTRAEFLPNGSLAVFAEASSNKQIALYDAFGARIFQIDLPNAGQGLAIINEGQTILAGGVAVNLTGQVIWQMQFQPSGVTSAPTSQVLGAWFGDTAVAVRRDGQELWRARLEGAEMQRAVISADGTLMAVIASVGADTAIFGLDMKGDVVLNERAASVSVDLALIGNRLVTLGSQGQQEFELR